MKKKIVILFTVCAMIVAISACGSKEEQGSITVQKDDRLEENSFESEEASESTESELIPETENGKESVPESEPESDAEIENSVESESKQVSEDISESEDKSEVETSPLYGEELESLELLEDMEATFQSALDFMVPEEQLDATSMVSNAILEKTDITINYAKDGICNITVKYPNAAKALMTAEGKLVADASQEETDEMLLSLANAIKSGEVEIIEKTLDVSITKIDDFYTIKWTTELYDAITGGLYSIE